MSILLEALRKTEKNQQQQQVPNIHSDEQGRPEMTALKTGPLVAMIAVALFVSGWFTWRQYQLPEGLYLPPVTLAAEQARVAAKSVGAPAGAEKPQAKADKKTAPASPDPLADGTSTSQRTPVETLQAPLGASTSSAPVKKKAVAKSSTGGTAKKPSGSAGVKKPSNRSDKTRSAAKKKAAHVPEPISYWELPDAIRADVPEIKYSVLVYNNDPAQRFVLVDGQRLAEGDIAQPGLVVNEIRRDGVIFSYRMYKFLVER